MRTNENTKYYWGFADRGEQIDPEVVREIFTNPKERRKYRAFHKGDVVLVYFARCRRFTDKIKTTVRRLLRCYEGVGKVEWHINMCCYIYFTHDFPARNPEPFHFEMYRPRPTPNAVGLFFEDELEGLREYMAELEHDGRIRLKNKSKKTIKTA